MMPFGYNTMPHQFSLALTAPRSHSKSAILTLFRCLMVSVTLLVTPAASSEPMSRFASLLQAVKTVRASETGDEEPQSKILSAYHGLDALPAGANVLCPIAVAGEDGMPVVFSVQIDSNSVMTDAFQVETASGELVTPICATLAPALEMQEQRTVLLAGAFGTRNAPPLAVEVVDALEDINGQSLQGERFTKITPLEAGPSLVLAERFEVDAPGIVGECPAATLQVVQITWEGGVSGPMGSRLGEPQRLGISVLLQDDQTVTPIALADDDPDNHVLVCLDIATAAVSVAAAPGLFHDPGDDPNPETSIDVNPS